MKNDNEQAAIPAAITGADGSDADFRIPTCYVEGHQAARKLDPELADEYIRYTTLGDPAADRAVEELARTVKPHLIHRMIAATVNNQDNPPENTPDALRELIESVSVVPEWYDRDIAHMAARAFFRNADKVLGGLVAGSIIEGFSTLISKSFRIRSRIIQNGVRRLQQNTLQLTEQFMPGGAIPGGDGWKLNLRIRLIHAQARMLLKDSDEWDQETYGLPLSGAHMLLGGASFSGRLMQHVEKLGGDFTNAEKEAYIHTWRYSGTVMGLPEEHLFTDMDSSLRMYRTAATCEPPPDHDAIIMANSIINSAPILFGRTDSAERQKLANFLYHISRELIGNDLANAFKYPKAPLFPVLPRIAAMNRLKKITHRFVPSMATKVAFNRFDQLFMASDLGHHEHSFALPTSVFDEDSRPW